MCEHKWELHRALQAHVKPHDQDVCANGACLDLEDGVPRWCEGVIKGECKASRGPVIQIPRIKGLVGTFCDSFLHGKRSGRLNPGCASALIRKSIIDLEPLMKALK